MEHQVGSVFNCSAALKPLLQTLSTAASPILSQDLADLMSHPITVDDIANWIVFDQTVYARNRVELFPNAEVIVMCWRPGHLTPIHDHSGSACAVKVVKGIATEISYRESNFKTLVPASSTRFFQGEVFHSFDEDVHQMGNLEGANSDLVTLHVYSPPLNGMTLFNQNQTCFADYTALYEQVSKRVPQSRSPIPKEIIEDSELAST